MFLSAQQDLASATEQGIADLKAQVHSYLDQVDPDTGEIVERTTVQIADYISGLDTTLAPGLELQVSATEASETSSLTDIRIELGLVLTHSDTYTIGLEDHEDLRKVSLSLDQSDFDVDVVTPVDLSALVELADPIAAPMLEGASLSIDAALADQLSTANNRNARIGLIRVSEVMGGDTDPESDLAVQAQVDASIINNTVDLSGSTLQASYQADLEFNVQAVIAGATLNQSVSVIRDGSGEWTIEGLTGDLNKLRNLSADDIVSQIQLFANQLRSWVENSPWKEQLGLEQNESELGQISKKMSQLVDFARHLDENLLRKGGPLINEQGKPRFGSITDPNNLQQLNETIKTFLADQFQQALSSLPDPIRYDSTNNALLLDLGVKGQFLSEEFDWQGETKTLGDVLTELPPLLWTILDCQYQ